MTGFFCRRPEIGFAAFDVFGQAALPEHHRAFANREVAWHPNLPPENHFVFDLHTARDAHLSGKEAVTADERVVAHVHLVIEF
jgi:hypothetical protein